MDWTGCQTMDWTGCQTEGIFWKKPQEVNGWTCAPNRSFGDDKNCIQNFSQAICRKKTTAKLIKTDLQYVRLPSGSNCLRIGSSGRLAVNM
jgi:hypothetical protein